MSEPMTELAVIRSAIWLKPLGGIRLEAKEHRAYST
jgi:hypothetical protein